MCGRKFSIQILRDQTYYYMVLSASLLKYWIYFLAPNKTVEHFWVNIMLTYYLFSVELNSEKLIKRYSSRFIEFKKIFKQCSDNDHHVIKTTQMKTPKLCIIFVELGHVFYSNKIKQMVIQVSNLSFSLIHTQF